MPGSRFFLRAVTIVGILASVGCSESNPLSPSPASIRGTEWTLVQINGNMIASTRMPTLRFADDSRANGFAGCNSFAATYSVSSDNLRFSAIAMTRMFCAGAMDLEQQYVAALEATRAYRVTGTRLELRSDSGAAAVFEKR